ncbi:MAG TPA: hypothetical protein VFG91_05565 [Woeseiaceae bacterium]|nr:hypothetical protein [Woeseiaceae bacterium]
MRFIRLVIGNLRRMGLLARKGSSVARRPSPLVFFDACRRLSPVTARSLFAVCALFVLRPAGAGETPADRLEISAEPPLVPVVPLAATTPGRRFIELPTLEYRFEVQTACGSDSAPRSLSINIADSRLALSGAALESRAAGELVLTVPARQLAPVAVDDFCVAGSTADGETAGRPAADGTGALPPAAADPEPRRLLTVPAVVSAQASLVCAGESGSTIRYVTQPLAVTFACMAPAPAPVESAQSTGER